MDEGNGMAIVVPGIVAVVVVVVSVVAVVAVVERNVGEEERQGDWAKGRDAYAYTCMSESGSDSGSHRRSLKIHICRKEILRLHRDASGCHPRRILGPCPVSK